MTTPRWYRIDKATTQITATTSVNVWRAAAGSFENAAAVLALGRFETPFAIYALGNHISEAEWDHGSISPAGSPL